MLFREDCEFERQKRSQERRIFEEKMTREGAGRNITLVITDQMIAGMRLISTITKADILNITLIAHIFRRQRIAQIWWEDFQTMTKSIGLTAIRIINCLVPITILFILFDTGFSFIDIRSFLFRMVEESVQTVLKQRQVAPAHFSDESLEAMSQW